MTRGSKYSFQLPIKANTPTVASARGDYQRLYPGHHYRLGLVGLPTRVRRGPGTGLHEANLFDVDETYGDVVSLDDALAYIKSITSLS